MKKKKHTICRKKWIDDNVDDKTTQYAKKK